jgi:hypothetical protein
VGSTLTETAFLGPDSATFGTDGSAEPAGQAGSRHGLLRRLIGRIDDVLRWWYAVHVFSDRKDCLLRIALAQTLEVTRFPNGSLLPPGTVVVDLHLWNERLCLLPPLRQGLARAAALRRHMRLSLEELARLIEGGGLPINVAAIRAQTALVPQKRLGKLLRVAAAFGFEPATNEHGDNGDGLSIGHFWQDLFGSALAWAFNPAALRRNGWRREPCGLWMSRAALLSNYGCAETHDRSARVRLAGRKCLARSSRVRMPESDINPGLGVADRSAICARGVPDRGDESYDALSRCPSDDPRSV